MGINDLTEGQKVNIEINIAGEKAEVMGVVASINKTLVLLEPIYLGEKLLGLPKGSRVTVYINSENGIYAWKNVEFKTGKLKGAIYHYFEPVGNAENVNRRNNFRVYIGQEMSLTTFTSEGPARKVYMIKDISETGFSFVTTDEYDVGRVVRLYIELKKGNTTPFTGKIVRIQRFEDRPEILYGCKFNQGNEQLAKYLMSYQLEKTKSKLEGRNTIQKG